MYKRFIALHDLNYDKVYDKTTGNLVAIDTPIPKGTVFTTMPPFEGKLPDSKASQAYFGRSWKTEFNKSGKDYIMHITERDLRPIDDFPGDVPPEPAEFKGEIDGGRKKKRRTVRKTSSRRRKSRRNRI
jgi:hypothetical protein